jgi:putative glycosyltransferase
MSRTNSLMHTLSVVTTTFNSEKFIDEFVLRTLDVMRQSPITLEKIIIIDDGSTDQTVTKLESIQKKHFEVEYVVLSRNFGHHQAILEGLRHAQSDLIFLIDSDLEEIPENFTPVFEKFLQEKADVVFGVQKKRRGNWIERIQGIFFYDILTRILGIRIPKNLLTTRLMTKEYVQAVLEYPERQVFLAGIFSDAGFKQVPLALSKLRRNESNYTLKRKMIMSLRMATSFSVRPLQLLAGFSLIYFLFSLCVTILLVARFFFFGDTLSGWTSLMLSVWISSGVISVILSLISIYVSELLIESKNRPRSIARKNETK